MTPVLSALPSYRQPTAPEASSSSSSSSSSSRSSSSSGSGSGYLPSLQRSSSAAQPFRIPDNDPLVRNRFDRQPLASSQLSSPQSFQPLAQPPINSLPPSQFQQPEPNQFSVEQQQPVRQPPFNNATFGNSPQPFGEPAPLQSMPPERFNAEPVQLKPLVPEQIAARDLPFPAPFNDPLRILQAPLTTPLPLPDFNPIVTFDGRIEPIAPNFALPIPELDPAIQNWGNRDGEFELYDLIEEYAGRWTRGDLPNDPHLTPPEERSWLRIEDWRTEVSWIVANAEQFGIGSAGGNIAFGVPKVKGLLVRPGGAIYWLNSPASAGVPDQVYDAELHGTWMHRFNDKFKAHVNVTGGIYSDFARASVDGGFRLSGSGIGAYEVHPDWQLVFGATYLNLGSIRMWPIGGVVWSPNDRWRLELIYPEGRITYKVAENEVYVEKNYVAVGFWGRTWEVERSNGIREKFTYSDCRATTGYERRYLWGITSFFEFGLAFNRDVEFRSGNGTYQPESQIFVRGGMFF